MPGAAPAVTCAICGRSLLVGERPVRFSPDGATYLDVCPLCRERALEYGWYREGGPSVPVRPVDERRGFFARLFHGSPQQVPPPMPEPVLERLTAEEQALVRAAALFNASSHRRTVIGLIRSLGTPRVSVVPLSGVNTEVVVTVCWDISWYQYRVVLDGSQPVQLAERGFDPAELPDSFTEWNAELDETGMVVPRVPE
jgi:hypothetical protein